MTKGSVPGLLRLTEHLIGRTVRRPPVQPQAKKMSRRARIVFVRGAAVQDRGVGEPLNVAGLKLHVQVKARVARDLVDQVEQLELLPRQSRDVGVALRLLDVEADVRRM